MKKKREGRLGFLTEKKLIRISSVENEPCLPYNRVFPLYLLEIIRFRLTRQKGISFVEYEPCLPCNRVFPLYLLEIIRFRLTRQKGVLPCKCRVSRVVLVFYIIFYFYLINVINDNFAV